MKSNRKSLLKNLLATAAVAMSVPATALAGHDDFLTQLARTDGDVMGTYSHPESRGGPAPVTAADVLFLRQLAQTDGNVEPVVAGALSAPTYRSAMASKSGEFVPHYDIFPGA